MRRIYWTFILLFSIGFASKSMAQNQAKAKVYYFSAQEKYDGKKYSEALSLLDKSVEEGGGSNAYIEALKAKIYVAQKDWLKAKTALDKCFSYNPGNDVIKDVSALTIQVDEQVDKAREAEKRRIAAEREAERQRLLAERKAEEERLRKEREAELRRQERERKLGEVANHLGPEIASDLKIFNSLVEGKPYLITYRDKFTSSKTEKSVLIFYGDKYIAYTIPSVTVVNRLMKDKVSFDSYYANVGKKICELKVKDNYGNRRDAVFKAGIHYSNILLGGLGDELLWTKGTQQTVFEQELYYYSYFNTLHCDVKLNTTRSEDYYNPYIETGTIYKAIDYMLVKDEGLKTALQNAGFKNVATSNVDNPTGLQIILKPDNNMKMLFPEKKVTYQLHEKVKGEYTYGNTIYKGEFLYYRPKSIKTFYGFMQFNINYKNHSLFSAITGLSNSYNMPAATFNSIYEAFKGSIGSGSTRYFTNSNYRTFFEDIPKMLEGEQTSLITPTVNPPVVKTVNKNEVISSEVLAISDKLPTYIGGTTAMVSYLQQNLNYPEDARATGVTGRVYVKFIVEKDGHLRDVKVASGVHPSLDKEAVRVVENMPNWQPGEQRSQPVAVYYMIPINFELQ